MNKTEPQFRASYTVLNTWASGNWQQAIKYYFKLEEFVTPAMVQGRELHEQWEKHIIATSRLPDEFGGKILTAPQPEYKGVVQLEPWIELVGKIDCYDNPVIYEFKSGKQSSEAYASDVQTGVYGVLATLNKMYVEKAEIHHWDQTTKKHDMSIVWLTDDLLKHAYEWIITIGGEMHNYFLVNNLYQRFGRG